ncbi:hypothetical protein OPS25_07725 [Alteromonas ponticola]|uniref:SHOCT domain-containing protein n=1 Tax=Alteromonas aquimaris TaxID=2998417 RepID=A0ABT3P6M5_9ALTE|nr:hypothetical protein [Alteromonas aquimaris]MCW8108379.1 hypothetical protein [Alteromonas aquimaris]
MKVSKIEMAASVIVFGLGLLNLFNEGIGPAMLFFLAMYWGIKVVTPELFSKRRKWQIAKELLSYKELFEKGILTEAEYAEKSNTLKEELLK